jgi:hypothetical protein
MRALRSFLEDLRENRLEPYIEFRPTYVRLDLSEERLVGEAELCAFVADLHAGPS